MELALLVSKILSASLFLFYGSLCLFSEAMVKEFKRYGLSQYRTLTGTLEVAGGLGILAGFFYQPLLLFSAAGLMTLMFMGMIVRVKIRDPWYALLPAFVLFCANLFILIFA